MYYTTDEKSRNCQRAWPSQETPIKATVGGEPAEAHHEEAQTPENEVAEEPQQEPMQEDAKAR